MQNHLKRLITDSDSPAPSPRQARTASPTLGVIENLNTSFSGSFYVDESLKALDPWKGNVAAGSWDF